MERPCVSKAVLEAFGVDAFGQRVDFYSSGLEKSDMLSYKVLMATFADPIIILFLGGFVLAIAITASVSMCLPISTPPNAIAHSTGLVKQNEMLKVGIVIGLVGMVPGYFTHRLM